MTTHCLRVLRLYNSGNSIFRRSLASYSGSNFVQDGSTSESDELSVHKPSDRSRRSGLRRHGRNSERHRTSSKKQKVDPEWVSGNGNNTENVETRTDFVSMKGNRSKVNDEWQQGFQDQSDDSRLSEQATLNPEEYGKTNTSVFLAPEHGMFFKPVNHDKGIQEMLMTQVPEQPPDPHLLKVAIIGTPNTGKSTLINSLLGRRIFSVSHKVHTTRSKAFAVINQDNTQIIILDTPGIVDYKKARRHHLARSLIVDHRTALQEADLVAVLVDASHERGKRELHFEILKQLCLLPKLKSILVLNKIDLIKQKTELLGITAHLTGGKVGGRSFEVSKSEAAKLGSVEKNSLMRLSYRPPSVDKPLIDDNSEEINAVSDHKNWWENGEDNSVASPFKCKVADVCDVRETADTGTTSRRILEDEDAVTKIPQTTDHDGHQSLEDSGSNNGVRNVSDFFDRTDMDTSMSVPEQITEAIDCRILESHPQRAVTKHMSAEGSQEDEKSKDDIMKEYLNDFKGVDRILGVTEKGSLEKLQEVAAARKDETAKKRQEDKEVNMRVAKMRKQWDGFDAVFMVSAKQGLGVADLKTYLLEQATPHNWEYHSDIVTSLTPEEIVKEAIREQLLELLLEEVPYLVQQKTIIYEIGESGDLKIMQELICPKASHAQIIKSKIGKIATRAQQQLMNAFHHQVHLTLHVSVDKNMLRRLGR